MMFQGDRLAGHRYLSFQIINNTINIFLIVMLLGARLGTSVREWRPAFCSSESQSAILVPSAKLAIECNSCQSWQQAVKAVKSGKSCQSCRQLVTAVKAGNSL